MGIIAGILFLLTGITMLTGHFTFSITPRPSTETPESLGLPFTDIYLTNHNNEVLHGWWIQHPDTSADSPFPTMILIHGWNRNCERMLPYLDHLSDLPVNVLCIEARGHGANSKNHFISQVGFAQDIVSAINWLVLQPEVRVDQIGVLGHSLGAAAAIYASFLDKRISCIVADGSYAHPLEIIRNFLRGYHIPYYPLGWLMVQYIQLRLWITLNQIAPENVIRNLSPPGLLIHGDKDSVIPVRDGQHLLANASDNFELWIASNANHSNTAEHPKFQEVLHRFLRTHLDFPDVRSSMSQPENTSATSDNPPGFD